jgi:hypothetical protein
VRAHLRAALSDGVNSFTVGAGIGHFVMAITGGRRVALDRATTYCRGDAA